VITPPRTIKNPAVTRRLGAMLLPLIQARAGQAGDGGPICVSPENVPRNIFRVLWPAGLCGRAGVVGLSVSMAGHLLSGVLGT